MTTTRQPPPKSQKPTPEQLRLAKERRRFARRRRLRQLGRMRTALLLVGLVVALAVAAWAVLASPLLAVRGVKVTGVQQMPASEVTQAAKVRTGAPLAKADLDAIRARVENLATVRSAAVSRCWPHDVCIKVTERQPAAVVQRDGALWSVDGEGVVYRQVAQQPPGVPVIQMQPDTSAYALSQAAAIVVALPAGVAAQVDHVDVRTMDAISLQLRSGATVVWGSAQDSALKAKVLGPLVAAQPKAHVYDVSVPGRPTVKP